MSKDYVTLLQFKQHGDATVMKALVQAISSMAQPGVRQTRAIDVRHCLEVMNRMRVADELVRCYLQGVSPDRAQLNPPELPSPKVLSEWLLELGQWFVQYAQGRSDADFEEEVSFTFADGTHGVLARGEVLMHTITRGGHARGVVRQQLGDTPELATQRFYPAS